MRISSMHIFNIANKSMADANQAVVKTQEQISSQKRVITAADDPVAATKIMQLTEELAELDQFSKNIDTVENNLAMEESVLGNVNNLITRIQELAVQAGNTGTLTPSDYQTLSQEVDSRLEELQNLLNTRNANGDYIFGGYKSEQAPFAGAATDGFVYRGDEGQQLIQIAHSTKLATTDSGKAAFVDIPTSAKRFYTAAAETNTSSPPATISVGRVVDQANFDALGPGRYTVRFSAPDTLAVTDMNGASVPVNNPYVPGQPVEFGGIEFEITNPADGDVFTVQPTNKQDALTTLARFSESMKSYDGSQASRSVLSSTIAETLDNLGYVQESVGKIVSSIGARMNTLESTRAMHADSELVTNEVLSDIRDLDMAEAATRLSAQSLVLQAAQQSFVRVSQLSLFNHLR